MPTHAEKRPLPHSPDQLFNLVADIERYPEFLPWCLAVRVRKREPDRLLADMVIGFKVFRERFTSEVKLDRANRRIDVAYTEGPFRFLSNHWVFEPNGKDKCVIDFYIDFEFHSKILEQAFGVVFNEAVQRMVSAFEKRAKALYG